MTKEKIKDLFKLDEIVSILKVMDNYKDVVSIKLKEVAINDNTYDILKNGDTVIIKDHNKSTGIGISYKYYESDNPYVFFNSYEMNNYHITVDYRFQNGHIVKLDGDISVVGDSLRHITSEDLMNSLKIEYVTDRNKKTKFDFNNLVPGNLKYDAEGATLCGIKVDPFRDEIISINGKEIPSYDEIKEFIENDFDKPLNEEIFNGLANMRPYKENETWGDVHKYMDKKSDYLIKFFDRDYKYAVNRVKSLIYTRGDLIEDLSEHSFSRDDLDFIGDIIEDEARLVYDDRRDNNNSYKIKAKRLGSN